MTQNSTKRIILPMNYMLTAIAEFHAISELPDLEAPGIVIPEVARLRYKLIQEELDEYREAIIADDKVEVLDALCDLVYVVLGAALSHGMGDVFDRAFAEVHRSNMTKFPDGRVIRRDDGKILKPNSWTPPNLEQFLV